MSVRVVYELESGGEEVVVVEDGEVTEVIRQVLDKAPEAVKSANIYLKPKEEPMMVYFAKARTKESPS